MLGCVIWERVSAVVTGRRSWVVAVAIALLSGVFMALIGANSAASQSPGVGTLILGFGEGRPKRFVSFPMATGCRRSW
jgi:hypothetical protein